MDESNGRKQETVRTFAKAWDFDTVIYSVGDRSLPFPVNITQLGFFAVALFLVLILYTIMPFLNHLPIFSSAIAKYIVLPFAGMKAATKLKVDGKKPYKWLYGEVKYLFFQPKRLNKFRNYPKTKQFTFERKVL